LRLGHMGLFVRRSHFLSLSPLPLVVE